MKIDKEQKKNPYGTFLISAVKEEELKPGYMQM